MTRLLLDTSVIIALLRGAPAPIKRLADTDDTTELLLSAIVAGEITEGFALGSRAGRQRQRWDALAAELTPCDFGFGAAEQRGALGAALGKAGTRIGVMDELIAAHALDLDADLATLNAADFRRVPDLRVQDWSRGASPAP